MNMKNQIKKWEEKGFKTAQPVPQQPAPQQQLVSQRSVGKAKYYPVLFNLYRAVEVLKNDWDNFPNDQHLYAAINSVTEHLKILVKNVQQNPKVGFNMKKIKTAKYKKAQQEPDRFFRNRPFEWLGKMNDDDNKINNIEKKPYNIEKKPYGPKSRQEIQNLSPKEKALTNLRSGGVDPSDVINEFIADASKMNPNFYNGPWTMMLLSLKNNPAELYKFIQGFNM